RHRLGSLTRGGRSDWSRGLRGRSWRGNLASRTALSSIGNCTCPSLCRSRDRCDACIATHPSDMAVAMRVLDVVVETIRPDGTMRKVPIGEFHRLPSDEPHIDTGSRNGNFRDKAREVEPAVELPT